MLVLISSLKLSIVPYAAGPESQGHSRTAFASISMSSCFPSFIVRWILNFIDQSTHENGHPTNKSDFTELRNSQLFLYLDITDMKNSVFNKIVFPFLMDCHIQKMYVRAYCTFKYLRSSIIKTATSLICKIC
jgi:hypothetical protein